MIRTIVSIAVAAALLTGARDSAAQPPTQVKSQENNTPLTLIVRCGASSGLHSVNDALNLLKAEPLPIPATIRVLGTCTENLIIKGFNGLVIDGGGAASLNDASNGTRDNVAIDDSRVTITGLTIIANGSFNTDGVNCYNNSYCTLINVTTKGAADGIGIYRTARGTVIGGLIQGNDNGINVLGEAAAAGVVVQNNNVGINVAKGGRLSLNVADPVFDPLPVDTVSVVSNNKNGVVVGQASEFACAGCSIENSLADGIHADFSAAVTVSPAFDYDGKEFFPIIKGNKGVGVYVGNLTSAVFKGPPNPSAVTGNFGPWDVDCGSTTSVTSGAISAVGGQNARTNCSN